MPRSYKFSLIAAMLSLGAILAGQAAADDAAARKLLNSQGCKACHALEKDGGIVGPSFESMRETLTRTDVRLKLFNQSGTHGQARIPDFSHLTTKQIDALVDFIKPGQGQRE